LKKFASHSEITELRNSKAIEIVPMSHMRGRNFHNCVVIVDESQNASMDQLKMVLTRHGQNSKTILIGDIEQSDLVKRIQGGLEICYNKLKGEPDIGTVALTEADIQRNELIGRVLRRLKE
jgi:phosphate starvation-inducible PhoH-like protein